jgi:hypothetical protein
MEKPDLALERYVGAIGKDDEVGPGCAMQVCMATQIGVFWAHADRIGACLVG